MTRSEEITRLLAELRSGDDVSSSRLLPLVYEELRMLAHAQRRVRGDDTLNTTALTHEAYLRIVGQPQATWPDRHHFYAYAGKAMRMILVDNARRRAAQKRGGEVLRVDVSEIEGIAHPVDTLDMLALDQALTAVAETNARLGEVIELHVFAGLSFADIAACLGLNERTVYRDWNKARALLSACLS